MMKFLEIIFICAIFITTSVEVDWCSYDLDCVMYPGAPSEKNTMCIYEPVTETGECEQIQDVQTPENRQNMLDLHNDYRNKLAGGEMEGWPPAANMRQMSWDSEIESVALRWALQCTEGHDSCRRTPKFEVVGQNYAMVGTTDVKFPGQQDHFDGWVEEIKDIAYPEQMLNSFQGGSWGHFTQVVWADSYKLGCGMVHYIHGSFRTSVNVCNYGPAGNAIGWKMYEVGEPASNCPSGTSPSKKYPNLCASEGEGDEGGEDDVGGGDEGEEDDVGGGDEGEEDDVGGGDEGDEDDFGGGDEGEEDGFGGGGGGGGAAGDEDADGSHEAASEEDASESKGEHKDSRIIQSNSAVPKANSPLLITIIVILGKCK